MAGSCCPQWQARAVHNGRLVLSTMAPTSAVTTTPLPHDTTPPVPASLLATPPSHGLSAFLQEPRAQQPCPPPRPVCTSRALSSLASRPLPRPACRSRALSSFDGRSSNGSSNLTAFDSLREGVRLDLGGVGANRADTNGGNGNGGGAGGVNVKGKRKRSSKTRPVVGAATPTAATAYRCGRRRCKICGGEGGASCFRCGIGWLESCYSASSERYQADCLFATNMCRDAHRVVG
eukprot:359432-Chlamydomonas_euryale.AAC.7